MAKEKYHYNVSFEIDLTFDPENPAMDPSEVKENIKSWLQDGFRDYFDKFKMKRVRCSRKRLK